jgi:4'-phosphopantetheinyl transferase
MLSADELARAERFRFRKDADRYTVARGLLRTILGQYLCRPPEQLRFRYGAMGKPELAADGGAFDPRFNLAHSRDLAVYAVTRGRRVGIDIEYIRAERADLRIAERFFSTREIAQLRALPLHAQREAFFACWTRKEAYLKAKGDGLALGLDRFDVSLAPGEPAALLATRDDASEAGRWSLCDLFPRAGYASALAVEGHDWRLSCWQAPE